MDSPISPSQIEALVDQWAAAELAGDPDAVLSVLTDDFVGIGPVGFALDREQWAARHRGGDVDNREFIVDDRDVRMCEGAAIVVARLTQETIARGHDTSAAFRVGLVARPHRDGWGIAQVQLSGPLIAADRMPAFAR